MLMLNFDDSAPESRCSNATTSASKIIWIIKLIFVLGVVLWVVDILVWTTDENPKGAVTRAWIDTGLHGALDHYRLHVGHYPNDINELLKAPINPNDARRWKGPYLKDPIELRDPWGNPYCYACPGRNNNGSYDFWSAGPDGASGTEDDVTNWQ